MKNEKLIKLREKANLTQAALARELGVSQVMISLIESGKRDPRTHLKLKLARYFGVSVEWLFFADLDSQQE